jgi:hypothetical protein
VTDFSPRTLVSRTFAGDPLSAQKNSAAFTRNFDRPIAEAGVTAAAEVADARVVKIRVRDRNQEAWPGRWLVVVWISTTSGGAPAGTQTVSWASGVVLATYTANQAYLVLTAADGTADVSVTVTGAGSRFVHAVVLGSPEAGVEVTWA